MKRFSVVSLFVLFSVTAYAQEKPPLSERKNLPPSAGSVTAQGEARMSALEEQVRSLVDEVAALRGELKTLRDAKAAEPRTGSRVLLTSARIEPGMLPISVPATVAQPSGLEPNPALPIPQVAQTQTYGGATSNAKLLNPDISLIGDFIGTAGRNTISPSRSLELHESEVGMQAIIDPYARADAFISFGETGVNVEEGYVTFTSLPAGLLPPTISSAARTVSTMPVFLFRGSCPPRKTGSSRERPRFTAAIPVTFSPPTAARMSALSAIFASTATSANLPMSISAVPTPAATTPLQSERRLIPKSFSPTYIPRMPHSAGSRSAAPSTIPSFSAPSYSGAHATNCLR